MSVPLKPKALAYIKIFEDLDRAHPRYQIAADPVDALRINIEYVELALKAIVVPVPSVFIRSRRPGIVATFASSALAQDGGIYPLLGEEYTIVANNDKDGAEAYLVMVEPTARTGRIVGVGFARRDLPIMNRAEVMAMLFGSLALQSLVIGIDIFYREGNMRLACNGAHLLLNFNPLLVLEGASRLAKLEMTEKFAEAKVRSAHGLLVRRSPQTADSLLVQYAKKYEAYLKEPAGVTATAAAQYKTYRSRSAAAAASAPAPAAVSTPAPDPAPAPAPAPALEPVVVLPPAILKTRDDDDNDAAIVLSTLGETPMSSLPRPPAVRYAPDAGDGAQKAKKTRIKTKFV
jgi:hypothetical protein